MRIKRTVIAPAILALGTVGALIVTPALAVAAPAAAAGPGMTIYHGSVSSAVPGMVVFHG